MLEIEGSVDATFGCVVVEVWKFVVEESGLECIDAEVGADVLMVVAFSAAVDAEHT